MTIAAGQPNVDPTIAPPTVDPTPQPLPPVPGVNYNDPNVAAAIERARQQEKQKLYGTLDRNKRAMQNLENRQAELLGEIEMLKSQLSRAGQPELKGDAAIQAKLDELNRSLQTATQRNEDLNRQIRQSQLESYKERRLRESGPEVFVEMVGGDSEAAIDESIMRAQEAYARQRDFFAAQFGVRAMPVGFPQPIPGAYYPYPAAPAGYPVPSPQVGLNPYAAVPPGYQPVPAQPTAPAAFYPPQPVPQAQPIAPQFEAPAAPEAAPAFAPPPAAPSHLPPAPVVRGYYHTAMAGAATAAGAPGMHVVPAAPAPGFPTVTAGAAPPPAPRTSQTDLKALTSEDAIRSGAYAANRGAIQASIRQVPVQTRR